MRNLLTLGVLAVCLGLSGPALAQHKLPEQVDTCLLTSSDGSFSAGTITAARWTTKKYANGQVAKDPEHKKTFDYVAPDEGQKTCNEMKPGGTLNP